MSAVLSSLLSQPFVRFALSGGVAAAVNITSRIVLSQWIDFSVSIVVAYLIGMTTAYVLMKLFVFDRSERGLGAEYFRFGLVNLVALAQVWVVSVVLVEYAFPYIGFDFHAEIAAHTIGVLSPVATSYFMHKYFTFSR